MLLGGVCYLEESTFPTNKETFMVMSEVNTVDKRTVVSSCTLMPSGVTQLLSPPLPPREGQSAASD